MYREWMKTISSSMRHVHKADEKAFRCLLWTTANIINLDTGEIRKSQLFVAVLGASSDTWAEAIWS